VACDAGFTGHIWRGSQKVFVLVESTEFRRELDSFHLCYTTYLIICAYEQ